jgi:hypothetical protein
MEAEGTKKEIHEKKTNERNELNRFLLHYKQLQRYARNALHFAEAGSSPKVILVPVLNINNPSGILPSC